MKPKNRVFCAAIQRSKLLFETEKKALNFIKFNGNEIEEISGFAPTRAYYCTACGGWHVTHLPKHNTSNAATEKHTKQWLERFKEKKKTAKKKLNDMLAQIEAGDAVKVTETMRLATELCSQNLISRRCRKKILMKLEGMQEGQASEIS